MELIFAFLFAFTLGDTFSTVLQDESLLHDKQSEQSYFLYDNTQGEFEQIPKTKASVDSLLHISSRERDRDGGLSFNAARQALTIAEDIYYEQGASSAFNLMGIKYLDFGDHEMAHLHYLKAMEIEERLGNYSAKAQILNNLAQIFVEQEKYDDGISYLEKSIGVWNSIKEEQQALTATNNLGVIHRRQGNYDRALDLFWEIANQSLKREEPDSVLYIISTLNIGSTYRNKGDYQRAKIHLNVAREYIEKHNYLSHLIIIDTVFGKLYKDIGQYNKALQFANLALENAVKEGYRDMIRDAHLLISEIHEALGNVDMAFQQYRLFHQMSDTLQTMQRGERIDALQSRFDVEQRDREIEILNKEAALQLAKFGQQQQFRSFLIFGVFLLLVIVGLLYRANVQKKKNNLQLKESRIEIEEQNKSLYKLNREKDEFLSIAAHDLRNPLSSINMAVDLINDNSGIDKNTLREYTELIMISSKRMLKLINSLLDIQTISDQSSTVPVQKLNANQLVLEAARHFNHPAESKGILLKTSLSEEKTVLTGESDNVLRIFDNLISNAIKYSPSGTTILVSTRLKGGSVQVSVSDQGPGISVADQKKLFGKFSKLSNKPTGAESSSGLGLFIVKKITESMGGNVWCESEVGVGSVFYVELPAHQPEISLPPVWKKKRTVI